VDKFIAHGHRLIHRLSFEQNGVLETFVPKNAELVRDPHIAEEERWCRGESA